MEFQEHNDNDLEKVNGGFEQGYYDFDEGDCFSYNGGAWYYKVLKAAHHIKGNTYVLTRTYRSDMTVYGESNHEAYKFDKRQFLGNNVF